MSLAFTDNPAPQLLTMYRRLMQVASQFGEHANPALGVDIAGFRRYRGDWVGAIITPWFIRLIVLPGGGNLWRALPAGDKLRLEFPAGDLEVIADPLPDSKLPVSLYCPLTYSVKEIVSQEAAQEIAMAAINTLFSPPAQHPVAIAPANPLQAPDTAPPTVDRRGFFRRLGGLK
jgi:[NiFe] hydrogenase assembly HybE family chaperone